MLLLSVGGLWLSLAQGFAVFPFDGGGVTLYLKWGDNDAGTIGGTVTWSLIPPGTPGDATYCGDACPGNSSSQLQFEIAPGMGFAPRDLSSLQAEIQAALDRWSAVTGIQFVQVDPDSGVMINDPTAAPPMTGHIRIGVFSFASGGAAVGYAPPPNGGTGSGDILFNANAFYQIAPGTEGEVFDTTFAPNDFPSLLLHEMGHAIGLAHPTFDGSCPVMQIDPLCAGIINRELDADDIAGARFLYGPLFGSGFEDP